MLEGAAFRSDVLSRWRPRTWCNFCAVNGVISGGHRGVWSRWSLATLTMTILEIPVPTWIIADPPHYTDANVDRQVFYAEGCRVGQAVKGCGFLAPVTDCT